MTTYSAKNITFTNKFTRIPDIKLIFKDASDNILTAPVNATNLSTTGFTIPSFTSDLSIAKCEWKAGGIKQQISHTVSISTRWQSNLGYSSGQVQIETIPAGTSVTVSLQNAGTLNYISFQNDHGEYIEPYTGPAVAAGQPLTITCTLDLNYNYLVIHSNSNSAPTFSVTYYYFP